jgi:hypothetical protein
MARRKLREKEDLLLLDLGFEPAGEDLWRRDGILFGREAALQTGQRELLERGEYDVNPGSRAGFRDYPFSDSR